jgi:glutathione S-transferase
MDIKDLAQGKLILWGANWSLYTAKVRSYLIKKGIDHIEICPSHPHFEQHVQSKIGHFTVPVLEYPNGAIISDSTDILYQLEKEYPENPIDPVNKTMASLAWFIHYFASEGSPRTFMHYRWSLTTGAENEQDLAYVIDEFRRSSNYPGQTALDYLPVLGIVDGQKEIVEAFTEKLCDILQRHFLKYPYILGGLPSAADFGMIAPFYPHLGRDISSSTRIKAKYPTVYRWIETMNRAQIMDQELWNIAPEYFEPDKLPDTVIELLELITAIYGPELIATANAFHQWLHEVPERPAGTIVTVSEGKSNHQPLGMIEYDQMGKRYKRMALLDPLIRHQDMAEKIAQMNESELTSYQEIMQRVGGQAMLELTLERPMVRDDFCEKLA